MNRFKLTRKSIEKAKKFLKDNTPGPTWAVRFKEDLSVKNGKLLFKKAPIVAAEDVEDYLRKRLYDKNDLQMGRDACHYQIQQEGVIGVSRRKIMDFYKAQKTLGQNRAATRKPKQRAGRKIKAHHIEFDLVFCKKRDVVECNERFRDRLEHDLSYFVVTTDKLSGLTRTQWVATKEAKVVTPIVIKHIQWIAKRLKKQSTELEASSDEGGEFDHDKIRPHVKSITHVSSGVSCEAKNSLPTVTQ